jgi:hypothetical protein
METQVIVSYIFFSFLTLLLVLLDHHQPPDLEKEA